MGKVVHCVGSPQCSPMIFNDFDIFIDFALRVLQETNLLLETPLGYNGVQDSG